MIFFRKSFPCFFPAINVLGRCLILCIAISTMLCSGKTCRSVFALGTLKIFSPTAANCVLIGA